MGEENFREEEKRIEAVRNESKLILSRSMRAIRTKIETSLKETEKEINDYITEVYRLNRQALKKEKERARRRY